MGWKIKIKKPRITVGKPRVTIAKPRVTVGGDVGRVGGQVVDAATDAIDRHLKAPLVAPRQLINVIEGKPIDDALRDAVVGIFDAPIAAAELVSTLKSISDSVLTRLSTSLGGETAGDIVNDILRLTSPLPPAQAAAVLRGVQLFIETGNIDSLNPIAILIAGEIVKARNEMWSRAANIPADVIEALPEELRARAGLCRFAVVSAIEGNSSLPKIAIDHFGKAAAVCLVDLIIFKAVPPVTDDNGRHYWSHELYHAQQYADWGVQKFVMKYVANEMKGGLNPIEEHADKYGCLFFPNAQPRYIHVCPVR